METFVGTLYSACVLQRGTDTLGSPSCLLVTKSGHLRQFQSLSEEIIMYIINYVSLEFFRAFGGIR